MGKKSKDWLIGGLAFLAFVLVVILMNQESTVREESAAPPIAKTRDRKDFISNQPSKVDSYQTGLTISSYGKGLDLKEPLPKENVIQLPLEPSVPVLFDDDKKVICPVFAQDAAEYGHKFRSTAASQWKLYPLDVQEAMQSIQAYKDAESCFLLIGETELANEISGTYKRWQEVVEQDFLSLRSQLAKSLEKNDYEESMLLSVKVSSYVGRKSGEYLNWLAKVIQYIGSKRKDKKKSTDLEAETS